MSLEKWFLGKLGVKKRRSIFAPYKPQTKFKSFLWKHSALNVTHRKRYKLW